MEPDQSPVTLAQFRQLHVKLPTETFREPAPSDWEHGNTKPSDVWLSQHPSGFLLLHNLHPICPPGKCMLLRSLDTGEYVVNKRLKRWAPCWEQGGPFRAHVPHKVAFKTAAPGELRFARLADPRVEVRLPDEPYFPELYAYGIPGGEQGFDRHGRPEIFSLYFKRFNGGTLSNLMEIYSDPVIGGDIPETFVWHVIEQLSRAVIYLQTGLTREDLDAGEREAKPGWVPLAHRNITETNVLLHFSEDDAHDPFDCCFPRVVLEGFDQANLVSDPSEWWNKGVVNIGKREGDPLMPPSTWEDMHLLGAIFRRLVTVHRELKKNPGLGFNFDVDTQVQLSRYLPENIDLAEGEAPPYSRKLILLLQEWEIPAFAEHPGVYFTDETIRDDIPKADYLIRYVLPVAQDMVKAYRSMDFDHVILKGKDGLNGDVSWVKPDPQFEMVPYSSTASEESSALADLENQLRWLFGPFIPVWYDYESVQVMELPPDDREFYSPDANGAPRESVPPSDGDRFQSAEEAGAGDEEHEEAGAEEGQQEQDEDDQATDQQSEQAAESGVEEEPRPERSVGKGKEKLDPEYVNSIRKYQTASKAKQRLVRVWKPRRKTTRASDRDHRRISPDLSETSRNLRWDAIREYARMMGDVREELEQVATDGSDGIGPPDDETEGAGDCGCSNCIRYRNIWIVTKCEAYNNEFKALHDRVIATISARPELQGKDLPLLEFTPLSIHDDPPIVEPKNPFDVESEVEFWKHNPFDPEYREDWEPDKYYPWRKWNYGVKRAASKSPSIAEIILSSSSSSSSSSRSSKRAASPGPGESEPPPSKAPRTSRANTSPRASATQNQPAPPLRRSARIAARQAAQAQQRQAAAQARTGRAPTSTPSPPGPRTRSRSRAKAAAKSSNAKAPARQQRKEATQGPEKRPQPQRKRSRAGQRKTKTTAKGKEKTKAATKTPAEGKSRVTRKTRRAK